MSYQMIRVRGSDEYRLQITRPTTIEAICLWTGIDRDELLGANPHLTTEELPKGQELTISARWLEEEGQTESNLLFGEWPSSVTLHSDGDEDAEGDEEPITASFEGQGMDEDEEDGISEHEATATDEVSVEPEPTEAPSEQDSEVGEEQHDETKGYDPSEEKTDRLEPKLAEEHKIPRKSDEPMTWRPFPKTVL